MDGFSADLHDLFSFLLPGFVTAWIFYGFTSYPKPNQFERVIQALIFTILVQALAVLLLESCPKFLDAFGADALSRAHHASLLFSTLLAVILGFLFAF